MPSPVVRWLLEPNQPAARYRDLVDLLDLRERDPNVKDARGEIGRRGWARRILALQKPGGHWENADNLYRPKYVATIWRWIVLAELGLTAKDPRMRKTCRLFLERYARPDGGFGGTSSHFCSSANITRTLIRCGYEDDPRVRSALGWLVRQQKEDGGWHCFGSYYGTLDCWEALAAYAAFPRRKWSRSINRSVERGAEFFLNRRLFHQGKKRYEPWFRFHYPAHYYYDILVGLDVLTSLGYGDDERLEPALEVVLKKRRSDGRWNLDAVHPDVAPDDPYKLVPPWEPDVPTPFSIERAGEPSKWITLTALRVLKLAGNIA
jgi:hypothetical protein